MKSGFDFHRMRGKPDVCLVLFNHPNDEDTKSSKTSRIQQEVGVVDPPPPLPAAAALLDQRQHQIEPAPRRRQGWGRSFREVITSVHHEEQAAHCHWWSCCWGPGAGKWGQWAGGDWRRPARAGWAWFGTRRPPFVTRHLSCRCFASCSLSTTGWTRHV